MPTASRHAEVWGSPIEHSLSPTLHRAAYTALGINWTYGYREVDVAGFSDQWEQSHDSLSGLSATMPLKEALAALPVRQDPVVEVLGVANTLYRANNEWRSANTDPWGVVGALAEAGISAEKAVIVGAGATARAVGYGLHLAGCRAVDIVVRDPARAAETAAIVGSLGLDVRVLTGFHTVQEGVGVVVSTLPGGIRSDVEPTDSLIDSTPLFDVAYSPWPTEMAAAWLTGGQNVVSGLTMLIHQAVRQIRFFVQGTGDQPLPGEPQMVEAMRQAVALQPGSSTPGAVGD